MFDDGNFLRQNKETKKGSSMVICSGVSFDGESSGGASEQSNLEQANGHLLDEGSSDGVSEQSNLEDLNENCEFIFPVVNQRCQNLENNFGSDGLSEYEFMVPESAVPNDAICNGAKKPKKDELKPDLHSSKKLDINDEIDAQVTDNSSMYELLNFDNCNSAPELEVC